MVYKIRDFYILRYSVFIFIVKKTNHFNIIKSTRQDHLKFRYWTNTIRLQQQQNFPIIRNSMLQIFKVTDVQKPNLVLERFNIDFKN